MKPAYHDGEPGNHSSIKNNVEAPPRFNIAFPLPVKVRDSVGLFAAFVPVMVPLWGKQLVPFQLTLLKFSRPSAPFAEFTSTTSVPLVIVLTALPGVGTMTFNNDPPSVAFVVNV